MSAPHLLLPKVDEVLQVKVIPVMHDGTIDDLADLPTSLQSGTSMRLSPNRTGWGSSSPPLLSPYSDTLSEKTKPSTPAASCRRKMMVRQMENCGQEEGDGGAGHSRDTVVPRQGGGDTPKGPAVPEDSPSAADRCSPARSQRSRRR